MIEFRNVSKEYKTKNGVTTKGLNHINLKIQNKGLIFITGKSGSGKSTMLNILGGLDTLDEGELLINGKNLSKFKNKEYDSYRNTYIGFIFQEFNLLEYYNVFENISLSLNLQNEKVEKKEIDNLLEKLDLKNLGNRKINELSGGQKQRVAIARALIKKPTIILADEPTGNLDKTSSTQIFNILKEISKEKLVIVVSHDLQSAKQYGDRIIELEDGEIISDTGQNIDDIIQKIDLKKSKLPLAHIFKMALRNLTIKPFKLMLTIILTAMSLIFMGFTTNCLLFDEKTFITNTMQENNYYTYSISNTERKPDGQYATINEKILTEKDLKNIENITGKTLNPVYNLYNNNEFLNFEYGPKNNNSVYYELEPYITSYVEIKDDNIVNNLIGSLPESNRELIIHKFLAEYIIDFGVVDSNGELYFPENFEDLVNSHHEIKLGNNTVTITGIIDDDNSLYQKAKETGIFETMDLNIYFQENYVYKASTVYVKGFTESADLTASKESYLNSFYLSYYKNALDNVYIYQTPNLIKKNTQVITKDGLKNFTSLKDNEIIISVDALKQIDPNFDENFNTYLNSHRDEIYNTVLANYLTDYMQSFNPNMHINITDKDPITANLVGISLDDKNYISEDALDLYNPPIKEIYSVLIYDNDINNLKKTFSKIIFEPSLDKFGTFYTFNLDHSNNINNVISDYNSLYYYILVVSLIFIFFTILLFSNFISTSISYAKKEIGILKALGTSSKDTVKIFAYESLFIGIIAWILSIIGLFVIENILNNNLFGKLYFILNGIIINPLTILLMLIFTIIISLLITLISITKITSIKPIDAILNK